MGRKLATLALTLAVGLTAREALAQSGVFRSGYVTAMGSSPTAVAAGDFDSDGAIDVVATSAGAGGNSVVVAIGFDDGTFSPYPALPVGSFPSDLIAGRFDGDNLLDLIVANTNDSAVVFLRGTGSRDCLPTGSPNCSRFFAKPSAPIEVGEGPVGLAIGDINDDGKLDVAVANEGSADGSLGSLSILLGQGDGTFVRVDQDPNDVEMLVNDLPTELGTTRAALGDVNGDDVIDALALNSISGTVSVFFGNGNGHFTLGITEAIDSAADLALGDIDGDGVLDLVTVENNADTMSARIGAGDGTFGPATTYHTGTVPIRVSLIDLDGDGDVDVLAANSRSQDVSYFANQGDGSFATAKTYVADAEPRAMAFADFNADGRLDVVVESEGRLASGASAAVLLGREDGTLHAAQDLPAGGRPGGLAVGDIDNDAFPDLVAATESGTVILYKGSADGLGAPQMKEFGGRLRGLTLADLNGDKRLDVIVTDFDGDRVLIANGNSAGGFGGPRTVPTSGEPADVVAGLFNNDKLPDLAVAAVTDNVVSILLQTSAGTGSFGAPTNVPVGDKPIDIAAIDVDCDGRDDLVVANTADDTVSVLRNNGNGVFSVSQTIPPELVVDNPHAIDVGDFDADGMDDIAVSTAGTSGRGVRIFYGDCSGTLAARANSAIIGTGLQVRAIVARDFTGDQIADLGVVNQTSNIVRTLLGLGSNGAGNGNFSAPRPDDVVSRMPELLATADFDGDGRYDLVAGNTDASANNFTLLLNCARDSICDPFGFSPAGQAAHRGDANDDGVLSAADIAAVAAEIIDGDGNRVEQVANGFFAGVAGADANGDGLVNEQDVRAAAHRIFVGG